ncbi:MULTISPECIES: hemolysin family protein [Faecalicoccus]|uniref:HlyC/CorC family transporter n=1 Tax=Faecalicoccus pleomorphus TaxID=1323 RepID=A0A7X9RJE1_9FIRM|nr:MULTISPECIES: hemolysin family protein [Faecalicoccus]MCI6380831.1 hemolysin family protein [Erysipelotrichaceae bacterium]MDB7984273.1 hemolysin family protein [Faecalicoccus pleomorphus]MDY4278082.1 hemolysin family protein [Faecalicoccus sp.]MDY4870070.1 hemolysin family protein [Faecalicoccus sp.]NME44993.1 HlyC/CorC family transporter [Faecalicoccus pleomorphus]
MIFALLLQIILICVNAVFAGAEIAVVSMNGATLQARAEEGNRKAKVLMRLVENPSRFLATIQVAITLAGYLGSAYATDSFADPLVDLLHSWNVPISEGTLRSFCPLVITLIMSFFSIVFGELVPKRIAMQNKEKVSYALSGTLSFISKAFAPLVWLLTNSTNLVLRLCRIDPEEEEEVTEEEIRMMVSQSLSQGQIEQDENAMIQNIFDFNDVTLDEICTHRKDVTGLDLEDDLDVWDEKINQTSYDCYPVYKESQDQIIGVLDAKKYLRMADRTKEEVLKKTVLKPLFVLEGMKADHLLLKMKQTKTTFAIVLDEYGGFVGVVTLKDLLVLLVEDLEEEGQSNESEGIVLLEDHTWRIQGDAMVEDVNKILGLQLSDEEYDTFSGYVLDALGGTLPDSNACFDIKTEDMLIKARMGNDHRVEEAIVQILEKEQQE